MRQREIDRGSVDLALFLPSATGHPRQPRVEEPQISFVASVAVLANWSHQALDIAQKILQIDSICPFRTNNDFKIA